MGSYTKTVYEINQEKEREALIAYVKAAGISIENYDAISTYDLRQLVYEMISIEEENKFVLGTFNENVAYLQLLEETMESDKNQLSIFDDKPKARKRNNKSK